LEAISPLFAKLFSKFPVPKEDSKKKEEQIPVIPNDKMPGAMALEYIIRVSYYDVERRHPQSLDDVINIIHAAEGFKVKPVLDELKSRLVDEEFLFAEPLRIYAVACWLKWEDQASEAARATLRHRWEDMEHCKELDLITGGQLRRLEVFHRKCGELARSLTDIDNLDWVDGDWSWFGISTCCMRPTRTVNFAIGGGRTQWIVASWWLDYLKTVAITLKQRPCRESLDDAHFPFPQCKCCDEKDEEILRFIDMFGHVLEKVLSEVNFHITVIEANLRLLTKVKLEFR
jgi:hypothetical protein